MFGLFLVCFYGSFAGIALINFVLMRRATGEAAAQEKLRFCVLIPARNEAENLQRLLPILVQVSSANPFPPKVYVFDDESEDATAQIVRDAGAVLIRPRETLPSGWTGKNRACHELAKAAIEDSDTEWMLFLDADVYPAEGFAAGVNKLIAGARTSTGLISGFPHAIFGRGVQPLFLGWVGWVLLTTNPYGLVTLTGKGHNRFSNGQFGCWRTRVYSELWPNETLRHHVLEDVMIGRLCADKGIGVEITNLSRVLSVKMYDTWQQTLDGMSKNSYEITGSTAGSIGIALFFFFVGWGWLLAGHLWPITALLFVLSGLCCVMITRNKPWGLPLLPVVLTIGSFTVLRSWWWRKKGTVTWKGRSYP